MWAVLAAPATRAQVCSHLNDLAFYSRGDYKVREVRLESPIDFLHAISSQLNALRGQLPLQPGSVFLLADFTAGKDVIDKALDDEEKDADPRSRIRVILAKIANCSEANPPQLDVVYRVFTTNYNSYLTHTWELKNAELERPATTAATTQARGFLTVKPFLDYNRTRGFHAGGLLRLQIPGIFDHVEISSSGSTTSNIEAFELTGSRVPGKSALSRLEYRIGYKHSDLPAGLNRLREGTLRAQVFGATKPQGPKGLIMRFGASLEGGNQQTDLTTLAVGSHSLANSGYGGLKTYFGVTLRTKNYSASGTYGLQLGTRGATNNVDFIKNLADFGLTGRWVPRHQTPGEVHRVLSLETQFTAGAIQIRRQVPEGQRFFGGNHSHNFIEGDSWEIRGQPFIRSIPENRLTATAGDIGGTKFVSFNLTVAKALWGRPILPKEIVIDPDFLPALEASKVSARNILVGVYLSKINVFGNIIAQMEPVDSQLARLRATIETLPEEFPASLPEATRDALEEERGLVSDAAKIISSSIKDKKSLPSKLKSLLKEANSTTCLADESCSQLTTLRSNLEDFQRLLAEAGFTEASAIVKEVRESLATQQAALVPELDRIDVSEAVRLADADMKLVDATLDSFVKELNWVAVSPVGVFDVARVWPNRSGFRLGIGGGVRFSLVNFNLSLGYAVNPKRNPGENRGALFLTMDITDMFR